MISKINRQKHHPTEVPRETISSIVNGVDPEMILCYGVRSTAIETWSCFLTGPKTEIFSAFDLLIIIRENEVKKNHEIVDDIRYYNTPTIKVTAIVHKATAVMDALKSGNMFFASVFKAGHLTYEKRPHSFIDLEKWAAPVSPDSQWAWKKWYNLGQQFLKGACFFARLSVHDLAAFMLHQATEHTGTALVKAVTGYRPATHNLGRIFDMVENFSSIPVFVFPRNTKEENDLFSTLARAYSDVRYKQGYKIRSETLSILMNRVATFHKQAETFFNMFVKGSQAVSSADSEKDLSYENK